MTELTNWYDYENIKKKLTNEKKYDDYDVNSNESNESIFNPEDFVLMKKTNKDGTEETIGSGYKINSFFMKNGKPILTTFNEDSNDKDQMKGQEGGKVSTPFENLAVPAGLFYINQKVPTNKNKKKDEYYYKKHESISDDIMDKLFGLVEYNKKQERKTRKQKRIHVSKQKSKKQR